MHNNTLLVLIILKFYYLAHVVGGHDDCPPMGSFWCEVFAYYLLRLNFEIF